MTGSTRQVADFVFAEAARTFRVPAVSAADRLADLKADSVALLTLTSTLQDEFAVSIDIVDMLLAETVEDIVVLVERLTATRPAGQDASPISDEAVLTLIRSRLPGFRDTSVIAVDTDLWEAGMDSLGNIAIMVAVEEAYGVEFPDELLTREVFSTAGRIAEAVRRIAAGSAGS